MTFGTSLAGDFCHSLNKSKSAEVKVSPEMFWDSSLYLDKCRVSCSQVMAKSYLLCYIPVLRKHTPCTTGIMSASVNIFGTCRANTNYFSNSLSNSSSLNKTFVLTSSMQQAWVWFKINAICLIKELFSKESQVEVTSEGHLDQSYRCHHQS